MAVETPSGQVLEFLTVTSVPYRAVNDEEARRIVRSHAIRDANRRKRLKSATDTKKIRGPTDQQPVPQSSLTTKFKLNKNPPKDKKETPPKPEEWIESCLAGGNALKSFHPSFTFALGAGLIDPFDTLPIQLGPRQQALLTYQNSGLEQSAFAIGSKELLLAFASTDPAWLNSVLCLISLHHDLQVGNGISRESLMYRAEALRIVNQRLIQSPQHVSDETIGAIASLANFDTANGLFENATMHVNGLVEIITNRGPVIGGLLPLDNTFLQKVVAWADLIYCTTWDLSPQLPLLSAPLCSSSISKFLLYLRSCFPPNTEMYSRHDLIGEMTEIFQVMRLLSIRIHTLPTEIDQRAVFDRGLYMSEYKLLIVLDSQDDLNEGVAVPCRTSHIYGSCRLAAYLYLYIVLREVPASAIIVQTVLKRLKGILGSANGDLLAIWSEDQHLFLWILYMGAVASIGASEREFFVTVLRRLSVQMGLHSIESFTGAVKEVLWEPVFCERGSRTRCLWAELQHC